MALNKIHDIGTGNSGDHWEISQLRFDLESGGMEAVISLYKDQASKTAGLRRMDQKVVVLPLPPNINGIVASAEADIKNTPTTEGEETPFFSDSTTV